MTHEVYKEMLALDALGLLEEADTRALAEHLQTCAECRTEAREMNDVSAMLAYAAEPVAPPAELRARLLENISTSDARTSPASQTTQVESPAPHVETDRSAAVEDAQTTRAADSPSSKVLPFARERDARKVVLGRTAFAFGAIAASLVIVALAATLATLWNRNREMRAEMQRLTARAEELSRSQNQTQAELARERETRELLTAPEIRMATLTGTEAAPRAHATIVYDRRTGRALLLADDLPPAPAGKAYQLWFIAGGRPPMPGKVFTTDAAGHAALRDQMPAEATNATVFAVTLEPAQGVAAPTGDKFLLGNAS